MYTSIHISTLECLHSVLWIYSCTNLQIYVHSNTFHFADQGKHMYTCIQLATYRNTFYHIKIINSRYLSTHSRSINVVVNLVYNKVAETNIIFTLVTPTTHTRTFNVMVALVLE